MKVSVVIPVYNGGDLWAECAESINQQRNLTFNVFVIDSSSTDNSQEISKKYNFNLIVIPKKEFNHGGTRNLGITLSHDSDIIVYLTQDAILNDSLALFKIVNIFRDKKISAVCGRQIPHVNSNLLAKHARIFNYPDSDILRTNKNKHTIGIKSVFMSNSFSAYLRKDLISVGGFPKKTILCEDMYVSATMLKNNYNTYYTSEAIVRHSHNYTARDELKRYFDIGVFHSMEPWIQNEFGGAGGEGYKYVISEVKYLYKNNKKLIPRSILNNTFKFLGMKLGSKYKYMPKKIINILSMHKGYWK
ncbi:N-glycosyltransferase [Photobacterium malacitanum]|uniref:N-glycosyltransferase n=1 Tax=Photobacterium malacitanum TaxID=2204294 RepID=A0A1Y6MIJ7_9GAMM|nr:glycosyltransferase family 2 protein [Photobacterium malacitanum]SMY35618.1 N-glycosyltransferase [Photobacterium malacitanum]